MTAAIAATHVTFAHAPDLSVTAVYCRTRGGIVTAASGDTYHMCALLTDGTVRCWGGNSLGWLGDGTTTQRNNPVQVLTSGSTQGVNVLSGVAQISAGDIHTCALLTDTTVRCWGHNGFGQLGDRQRHFPVP